mmetsp:Transcript_63232/g.117646  ORF Transcript_63232/g.117646 Transcript_63232/m.117646 type:complete len:285 (+) Transcript_63232:116-970(+)
MPIGACLLAFALSSFAVATSKGQLVRPQTIRKATAGRHLQAAIEASGVLHVNAATAVEDTSSGGGLGVGAEGRAFQQAALANGSWPVDDSARAASSNVSWNVSGAANSISEALSCGIAHNHGGQMLEPPAFTSTACLCASRCGNNTACVGWTWSSAVKGGESNCFLRSTWDPTALGTCAGQCWSAEVAGRGGGATALAQGGTWAQSESPAFCRWLQTVGCSPDGPRNPTGDRSCDTNLSSSEAGFCDCDGNGIRDLGDPAFACAAAERSCAQACRQKVLSRLQQ